MSRGRMKDNKTMRLTLAAAALLAAVSAIPAASRAEEGIEPKPLHLKSDGIFGSFDRAQIRRGLKVYLGVCSACHALEHLAYRNLAEIGLTTSEIRAIASEKRVTEIGDDGQPKERPALPRDMFVSPFPTAEAAAAANNGKAPPDLSLVVKAREGGAAHVYSILTGYGTPPKDWRDSEGHPKKLAAGQYYNTYYPGNIIAMPPPLTSEGQGGQVEYGKGDPKPTVDQMAQDVAAFLHWASEPTMEVRKRTGIKVMLFLLFFTGVFFVVKRRVWRNVH
jgi:ubiquinol-cytochrome c reductase cytochrome c1 subunit